MKRIVFLIFAACLIPPAAPAGGQEATETARPSSPAASPAAAAPGRGGPPGATPSPGPGGEQPTPGAKPGESPKPDEAGKEKKGEEPQVIRRGEVVKGDADPAELAEAVLDADGRVAFQFRNQPWAELIDWLSQLADRPIDWQELPADRVNITTPGRYNVGEVVDLLNRHLLSRGYTLLSLDGGLTVVKCASVNPALVPRLDPDNLDSVPPHSFVRTTLDVGWLSAEKLAEELKPMISENGKLTALTTTNRIEAMDAAITLRQVAQLLERERGSASRELLAPEFRLRHIPAEEAKRLLEQFLGLSSKPDPPMTPEQMQQQQMQMRMQAQQGGKPPAPEPKKPEISVVANTRQNSILIQAPPDRVAVATEFLKRIDVPGEMLSSLADVQSRVQVFRMASLDPEKLLEIILQMNILEPSTRIQVDAENGALIVSGSAADRFIIDQLKNRLDGSGRQFEVLQLRRLEAADVAESIAFLMGKKEPKEDNSRSRYYYSPFGSQPQDKKKEDEFRVAANTRFRQVLLWANELEMAEVRNLLIKLGELPPPGGSERMIRVIDADASPETLRYLKNLQQQWQRMSPNPLVLPPEELFEPPAEESSPEEEKEQPEPGEAQPVPGSAPSRGDNLTSLPGSTNIAASAAASGGAKRTEARLTSLRPDADANDDNADDADDADDEGEATADRSDSLPKIESVEDFDRVFPRPDSSAAKGIEEANGNDGGSPPAAGSSTSAEPIRIQVDSSGNLILSSDDTAALDLLENMMLQITPPRRQYRVFRTKHASATWVKLNLEDYFKEEDSDKKQSDPFMRWYWGFDDSSDKSTPEGLGRAAKLRFIADIDTGTIVVSNATQDQLRVIEELIRLWDVPEPLNKTKVRFTRLVTLEYGRAGRIAETIKETYRDLLSSNDKAFQQGQQQQQGSPPQKTPQPRGRDPFGGSELVEAGSDRQGGGADFTFKGKLSLGVDETGNTLLVSAEGEPLLDLVCSMIRQLDQASDSGDGVRVVNLSTSINPAALESALRTLQSSSTSAAGDQARSPASNGNGNGAVRPQSVRPQSARPAPAAESPDG